MRYLKGLTAAVAIAGAAALVLASRASARPLTRIGSVSPAMNFAYVQVAGVVAGYPSLDPAGDYLSFQVQDASGELRVSAYRGTVQGLLNTGRVPMPGHVVTLEGTLRVRDDEASLTLNTADALVVSAPPPQAINLAALDAAPVGARVTAAGQVRSVREVGGRLRIASLRQGSAETDVVLPLDLPAVFGTAPSPAVGDWVTVTGGVGVYRGARQLQPACPQDVRVSPLAASQLVERLDVRPIGALHKGLAGEWVAVRGNVLRVDRLRQGQGALIDVQGADGAKTTIAVFDAWLSVPFSTTLRARDSIVAQGLLVNYKGKLEVQPELPIDLVSIR